MIRLAAVLVAPVVAVAATVLAGPDVLGEHERVPAPAAAKEAEPQAGAYAATEATTPTRKSGSTTSRTTAARSARQPAQQPAQQPAEGDPLLMRISTVAPAAIPSRGPIVIRGWVVNRSPDTWYDPKVYPLNSTTPMTTVAELREAAELDPTAFIGERITTTGVFVDLPNLSPGERVRFRLEVPRRELAANGLGESTGVYWLGTQVLAADENGVRDGLAKARDRLLVPLVDQSADAVSTSLVVPLRASTLYDEDGLDTPERWTVEFEPGGRLANLVDFVDDSGSAPVTWLVDPAVLDAAAHLAAGNPPRSVEATLVPDGSEDSDDSDDEETPEAGGGEAVADSAEAIAASGWLEQVTESLSEHRVLALPYGDLDVAAAAQHRPSFYEIARELSVEALEDRGITARSAVVPPSGLINLAGLNAAAGSELLVSDEAIGLDELPPETGPPSLALSEGELVSVYDSSLTAAAAGPVRTLELRQRILAEAALRANAGDDQGLLVALPHDFDPGPGNAGRFFDGLAQPFVSLASGAPTPGADVPAVGPLSYSQRQVDRQLEGDAFDTAAALIESGESLDRLLPDNDQIAAQLLREALATTSYAVRELPITAQMAALDALEWSREQLSRVTIQAPSFVILSARSGPFAVNVRNRLAERVTVQIRASPNPRLSIEAPEEILLEPESQTTVNLDATANSIGVTTVRLLVTDVEGQPLGGQAEVSVRSNQVGRIIWVVMGVGVGILFLAIAVRLVRRVRRARAA